MLVKWKRPFRGAFSWLCFGETGFTNQAGRA